MSLVFLDKAEVLDNYSEEIRTVSTSYQVPAVIRLMRTYAFTSRGVRFSRINVLTRDGFRCCYCAKQLPIAKLTFDHVVPRDRGGRTDWLNITSACHPCNNKKRNRTPDEAGMKLLRPPTKPAYLPMAILRIASYGEIPEEWRPWGQWEESGGRT